MHDVTIVKFGSGKVTVNWGTRGGLPAVFIEPAPAGAAGVVGESAEQARQAVGLSRNSVADGAVILQFETLEGAQILLEDIKSAVELFSTAGRRRTT